MCQLLMIVQLPIHMDSDTTEEVSAGGWMQYGTVMRGVSSFRSKDHGSFDIPSTRPVGQSGILRCVALSLSGSEQSRYPVTMLRTQTAGMLYGQGKV